MNLLEKIFLTAAFAGVIATNIRLEKINNERVSNILHIQDAIITLQDCAKTQFKFDDEILDRIKAVRSACDVLMAENGDVQLHSIKSVQP